MKKIGILVLLLPLFLASCEPTPRIIEHQEPELAVDIAIFEDYGCLTVTGCPNFYPKDLQFQIFDIDKPSDILGGLDPMIPLVSALTFDFEHNPNIPAVFSGRCAATVYFNYLAYLNGEIIVIDSKQDLADVFAPIESKNEALSYAIAATGYHAVYDLETIENIEIYSNRLEETFVRKKQDGYIVHLFDYFLCHCGPHIIRAVDVFVSKNGEITVSEPVEAYRDTRLDNVCFD